jgi:hypothetical protein
MTRLSSKRMKSMRLRRLVMRRMVYKKTTCLWQTARSLLNSSITSMDGAIAASCDNNDAYHSYARPCSACNRRRDAAISVVLGDVLSLNLLT